MEDCFCILSLSLLYVSLFYPEAQGRSQKSGDGGPNFRQETTLLKQEVIIIASSFQQIIHFLSKNNEQRNVDELGVIVSHWSQLLSWREGANQVVRFFGCCVQSSSLIQREHTKTNVHLQSAFLATALAYKAAQERV